MLLFYLFGLLQIVNGQLPVGCSSFRNRYEIHDLTPSELDILIDGFAYLYNTSRWTTFTRRHWDVRHSVHGCSQFLPFHSVFLYDLETALREYNNNITLPYWNWTLVSQNPTRDPILQTRYFGDIPSNRDCNNGTCCVTTGGFANWRYTTNNTNICLSRNYQLTSGDGFFPWRFFTRLMNTSDFHTMAERLEQLHSNVHAWVGGSMTTHYSPLDPLFFLHHGFIDKVWYDWKRMYPNQYGWFNCDRSQALPIDTVFGYNNFRVRDTLSNNAPLGSNGVCVRYIDYGSRNESAQTTIDLPPNTVRDTLANITIDVNWLRRNGFNESQVNQLLRDVNNQTRVINQQIQNIRQNQTSSGNRTVSLPGVGILPKESPQTNTSVSPPTSTTTPTPPTPKSDGERTAPIGHWISMFIFVMLM